MGGPFASGQPLATMQEGRPFWQYYTKVEARKKNSVTVPMGSFAKTIVINQEPNNQMNLANGSWDAQKGSYHRFDRRITFKRGVVKRTQVKILSYLRLLHNLLV